MSDQEDWEEDLEMLEDERYIHREWNHCMYEYRFSEKDKDWAHTQASCFRKFNGLCARVAKMPDGRWGVYTREKGY